MWSRSTRGARYVVSIDPMKTFCGCRFFQENREFGVCKHTVYLQEQEARWEETARMRAVTSLMRVHQLVLTELDELLRPLGLTFARYEVLVLLTFSRTGELPLKVIGSRLMVHPTSVTNAIDRLVAAGYVDRRPNPADGRGVLAAITERGRLFVGAPAKG